MGGERLHRPAGIRGASLSPQSARYGEIESRIGGGGGGRLVIAGELRPVMQDGRAAIRRTRREADADMRGRGCRAISHR